MKIKKILCLVLCLALCMSMAVTLTGCGDKKGGKPEALVIMTEQLDGLFNPFFYTSANDGTIVSMTQISMMGADYVNGKVQVAFGDNEAVVTKDYEMKTEDNGDSSYYFVLKNGIKFSDGQPLTMEDVLFSYYVYLDPVYTGSNTLYSTKILGLDAYRTQTVSSGNSDTGSMIDSAANDRAANRVNELISIFMNLKQSSSTGEVSEADMRAAITSHSLSSGYQSAVSNDASSVTNAQLEADYDRILELFKEELGTDYESAQESFEDAPYDTHKEFEDPIFCFMFYEGKVEVEYAKDAEGKIDRTTIETMTPKYPTTITTKEDAIKYVFEADTSTNLSGVLSYSASAGNLMTEFVAKAKEVILHENAGGDGLTVESIEGIQSLAHVEGMAGTTVNINGTDYTIASGHNPDGTVTNPNEYDILKVTIEGVDPKAMWNFSITVAPQHYYGQGSSVPMDIANNQFGVEYASFDFMTKVIQSPRNIKVPMGAGPYKATDAKNNDNPEGNEFFREKVVYFKANENFLLGKAKIENIRYQVVSATNAIGMLDSGTVHFVSPQYTQSNIEKLDTLASKGIMKVSTDQLGYGYIGINAGKVPDINLRKAIMAAMNTKLAINYYSTGTASTIYWPMSTVSWAYPKNPDGSFNNINGHSDYIALNYTKESAKAQIEKYMSKAGVAAGDPKLTMKFTIAGSNLTDHPTYTTFQVAAELLNECGWNIEVVPDTQALTKLSTGSLTVWAAAWGSALDPDMYQVYHKNSTATSTLAWGYREILASPGLYPEENAILNDLSDVIDKARETDDQAKRTELYKEAMGYVLDLAVEMPVYQRDVLYAYNANVIKPESLPEKINPYTSPLDRIWELEFAD